MLRLENRTTVLVDEHPLWLDTVAQVVADLGVQVIGKVTRASEALPIVTEHSPDLLITGIRMPEGEIDGIALVRESLLRVPDMEAIVLSMYDDAEHVEASFNAGASAYVLKSTHPDDLKSAIRQAFEPSVYFASDGRSSEKPLKSLDECRLDPARAGDPAARRGGGFQRPTRQDAVDHRADGEVPPVEHLPEARRLEPHRGGPLGPAARSARPPTGADRGALARPLRRRLPRRCGSRGLASGLRKREAAASPRRSRPRAPSRAPGERG